MQDSEEPLQRPPGVVGEIAEYILEQAPRPVGVIAITGALAFFAGIVGRQYNVSGTGLNNYFMLVAPTGTGKEAINSGINKLATACHLTAPHIRNHIGPGEIRSDAALLKQFPNSKCFVSVFGEVGMLLKRMSGPRANPNDVGIMRVWLDLYHKSGRGNVLNPMVYSDAAKSTEPVVSPSFTIVGESTPERFYAALDEAMVADGLLPRFTIFEYHGDRPDMNVHAAKARPSDTLIAHIGAIVAEVNALSTGRRVIDVEFTPEAAAHFSAFNDYCDRNIRGSREVFRHVFNRAHLKAMKLAALVAVGLDWKNPVIGYACATWATDIVYRDATNLLGRFERGEVGDVAGNDLLQQDKVRAVIKECVERPFDEVSKQYAGKRVETHREQLAAMHSYGLVTHQYLQRRLLSLPVFKAMLKPNEELKRAIQSLAQNGEIETLTSGRALKAFGLGLLSYRFTDYDPDNLFEATKNARFIAPDMQGFVKGDMK